MRLAEVEPAWGYGSYCCFRLALMNYYGVGTYKNEIKAKEYKTKAIKLGVKAENFNF